MANILYRKQKQQKSLDNGVTWIDTGEYRVGNILENPSNCTSDDSKQCRWTELPETEGYYCDTTTFTKYTVQVEECSENGIIWTRTGNQKKGNTLIENYSKECGYIPSTRWVISGDPIVCECGSVIYYEYEEEYINYNWTPTGNKRESEDFALTSGWSCCTYEPEEPTTTDYDCLSYNIYDVYKKFYGNPNENRPIYCDDIKYYKNNIYSLEHTTHTYVVNNESYYLNKYYLNFNGIYEFLLDDQGISSNLTSKDSIDAIITIYKNKIYLLKRFYDGYTQKSTSYLTYYDINEGVLYDYDLNQFDIEIEYLKGFLNKKDENLYRYIVVNDNYLLDLETNQLINNIITCCDTNVSTVCSSPSLPDMKNKMVLIGQGYGFIEPYDLITDSVNLIKLNGYIINKGNLFGDLFIKDMTYLPTMVGTIYNTGATTLYDCFDFYNENNYNINSLMYEGRYLFYGGEVKDIVKQKELNNNFNSANDGDAWKYAYSIKFKDNDNFILTRDANILFASLNKNCPVSNISEPKEYYIYMDYYINNNKWECQWDETITPKILAEGAERLKLNEDGTVDVTYEQNVEILDDNILKYIRTEYLPDDGNNETNDIRVITATTYYKEQRLGGFVYEQMPKITEEDDLIFTFEGSDYYRYMLNNKKYSATTSPYSTSIANDGITALTDTNRCFYINSTSEGITQPANTSFLTELIKFPDTSNVTDMTMMFFKCSGLTSLDLSSFNTSACTNMYEMFAECYNLTSLDVSSFNTSACTNMESMFYKCSGLTSLDVSSFNTSACTNMNGMFQNCRSITSLDVSNFNTSNVTDMGSMFYNCSGLTSLNLSNFNTSNVTNMTYMFYGCSNLTSIDLSNFDTSNIEYYTGMFSGCNNLTTIYCYNCNQETINDFNYLKPSNCTLVY